MSEPSWSDFSTGSPSAGKAPPADSEFDTACAEVFTSGAGKRLLAVLRKRHFDSSANLQASEAALRVRVTQQQFVRDLELACARGLAAPKKTT